MRFGVGLICAITVTLSSAGGWAQDVKDKPVEGLAVGPRTNEAKAAALRAEGEAYFKADDCRGAIELLRLAWALREDGKTAALLGECELQVGHEPMGAFYLAQALELVPEGADRARIAAMLQGVSSRLARLEIVANEAGVIVIVGDVVEETPTKSIFAPPGEIRVIAKKAGMGEQERKLLVGAGETARIDFAMSRERKERPLDQLEKPTEKLPLHPAYFGVGSGVLAIFMGIDLRVRGKNSKEDAETLEADAKARKLTEKDRATACARIQDKNREHDAYVNTSTGFFVAGSVLLGGSFIYGLTASRKVPVDIAIHPILTSTDQGFVIEGRF